MYAGSMKPYQTRSILVSALLVVGGQYGQAQGTFQNLNFENPILPLIGPGIVPTANALPGWTVYYNGVPGDSVSYPEIPIGFPSAALVNPQSQFVPAIQGNYSVWLQVAAIGQTGRVPDSSLSLRFLQSPYGGLGVSFGGQSIPLVQVGNSGSNLIMAGDISRFAGQIGELLFGGSGVVFDAIQFSNQPIPEPSSFALAVVGGLFVGSHLRTWRRSC